MSAFDSFLNTYVFNNYINIEICSVFDKLDLFKYYFNYLNVYSVL